MTKQFRILALAGNGMGPSTTAGNWLLLVLDTRRYREQVWIHQASESVLDELNNCPPAPGYERVEIPGERDFRKNPRRKFWSAKEPGNKFKIWLVGWVLYE
jgi:LDH2 family malate/lactate/ureidoglycolate dehydrogenase